MKKLSTIAMAISLLLAAPAFAVDEHHPEPAPSNQAAAKPGAQASVDAPATVKKMQGNVKKMQEQLKRVATAKTDNERQKAMAEHMATMQENMHLAKGLQADAMDCSSMHGGMHGGGMHDRMHGGIKGGMMGDAAPSPDRMQQMEKRMEMMEQMMQRKAEATGQTPTK